MIMRRSMLWTLAGVGALALFPLVAPLVGLDFYISFVRRVLIFALAAAGLNLVLGYGGMVALGHAAFFGAGAYAAAMLATAGGRSALVAWPAAALLAALLAWIVGAISLRTRGVYFIMITLAFAQMLYYVFISLRQYGGEDGLNLPGPAVLPGVDLGADVPFYYVVLLLFVLVSALLNRLTDSRYGAALQGVRENESRMTALGYPVYRIKLGAFVIGAAVAGLAGALLANNNLFVSPNLMHWTQSANLLIMVLVGGMGLRYGGLAGAAVMLTLEEVLRMWTEYWHLPLGLVLLAVVFGAPRGLAGLAAPWFGGRRRAVPDGDEAAEGEAAAAPHAVPAGAALSCGMDGARHGGVASAGIGGRAGAGTGGVARATGTPGPAAVPALQAQGLVKRFGALTATDNLSLALMPGEIHAVIGPNGAGKSTLIHLLSGTLPADGGVLLLGGEDIARLPAHRRVGAGLSRSYQVTNVFKRLSVRDNLLLAVQAHDGGGLGCWQPRAADRGLYRAARALARECGLDTDRLDAPAETLPHGEQRKLEFALALAARPRVLLLDEPMAGMGPDETARLADLIESMRGRAAMLLVEHDMEAVFRLADRISVLVYGRIIATGTPEEIRNDAAVRQAYLGDEMDASPLATA